VPICSFARCVRYGANLLIWVLPVSLAA